MRLTLGALPGLLVSWTAAAAPIAIEGGVPGCVRPASVESELERRVHATGGERVRLVPREEGRLDILFERDGNPVAARSLPLCSGDCAAVERTAILLLTSCAL